MAEGMQIAIVVLVAFFVGVLTAVLVPVLLTLRSTLKQAATTLDRTRDRMAMVLDQTSMVLAHTSAITGELAEGSEGLRSLIQTLYGFAESLSQIQKSVRFATAVGASVAPAVAAALRSLRGHASADGLGNDGLGNDGLGNDGLGNDGLSSDGLPDGMNEQTDGSMASAAEAARDQF